MQAKPSVDGWTVAFHLCHIHETRTYWLFKAKGEKTPGLLDLYHQVGDEWAPSDNLKEIHSQLLASEAAVRDWIGEALAKGTTEIGQYDHPVLFLQHMIWHEGYHFGLLMLALRLAGAEPSEAWEEEHVWALWRGPEEA